ncbi:5848_t:CDS:2, partial [Scutellospora calospora]
KNSKVTTVVNKTDMIDTTYRFFKMEILAGENNMITEVKESNCRFRFDFSQVYWNSRLHTEHGRLLSMFKKGDVFAGVGPFAIPAAKKGCIVYANDLNPASYNYLMENIKLNKVHDKVYPYNLDGKLFISKAVLDLQKAFNDGIKSSKTSK